MKKNQSQPQSKGDIEILKIFVVLFILTLTLIYGVQRLLEPKTAQEVAPASSGAIQSLPADAP